MATQERPIVNWTTNTGADEFELHPFLFNFSRKKGSFIDFNETLDQLRAPAANSMVAIEYAAKLNEYRHLTWLLLESEDSNTAELDDSLQHYISFFYALVNSAASLNDRTSVDSRRHSFEDAPFLGIFGNCKLRTAIRFTWEDSLVAQDSNTSADSVFELASILIAAAVFKLRKAHAFSRESTVKTYHSVEMYRLLREAAGLFDAVYKDVIPVLGVSRSLDCNLQLVNCLKELGLADAQGVTVLRAIKKGNADSLISGLAADTALLFRDAGRRLEGCKGLFGGAADKMCFYLKYKQTTFEAYQYCYAARVKLEAHEGGAAVRCAQEALAKYREAQTIATSYDSADPPSNAQLHKGFDAELEAAVTAIVERAEKDNKRAYMQAVPKDMPELPEIKRLVTALPFLWPIPATLTLDNKIDRIFNDKPDSPIGALLLKDDYGAPAIMVTGIDGVSKEQEEKQMLQDKPNAPGTGSQGEEANECWRWVLFLIAIPVLVVLSVVGVVVWIVLLPFKIICCPLGCLAQIVWDVFEYLVKAPFRAMLWASGKPWLPNSATRPSGQAPPHEQ